MTIDPVPPAPGGAAELHLASLLVHVSPGREAGVRAALAAMDGVEVHLEQDSKLVVTLEGPHEGWIADRMTAIHLMGGVLSAVMVFHHMEAAGGEDTDTHAA